MKYVDKTNIMMAAVFERPGLENLQVTDVQEPTIREQDVLIKVKTVGINPIDYLVTTGSGEANPIPHIPGAETAGVIEEVGSQVNNNMKKGDMVVTCICGYIQNIELAAVPYGLL